MVQEHDGSRGTRAAPGMLPDDVSPLVQAPRQNADDPTTQGAFTG